MPELVGDFNCDRLIKKLLDAELDGEMLSKQAALFADAADYLKDVRHLCVTSFRICYLLEMRKLFLLLEEIRIAKHFYFQCFFHQKINSVKQF